MARKITGQGGVENIEGRASRWRAGALSPLIRKPTLSQVVWGMIDDRVALATGQRRSTADQIRHQGRGASIGIHCATTPGKRGYLV